MLAAAWRHLTLYGVVWWMGSGHSALVSPDSYASLIRAAEEQANGQQPPDGSAR
jgi:hypothetical protein